MSYEPPSVNWHHPTISTLNEYPLESRILLTGGPTSTVWPAANLCLYVPLYVYTKVTVYSLWCSNGATVNGNICMGLYDENFNRLAQTGVVAQAGTNAPQEPSITAFELPMGRYYFALALSSTTGTIRAWSATGGAVANPDINRSMCMGEETVASTQVPTTMNPTGSARVYLPALGLRIIPQAL
jgi:hypothetical protein